MTIVEAIDVRELLEHPGTSRRVRLHEPLADLRTEMALVPADAPVDGELLLEGVIEGVYVSGAVVAPVRMTCARCLREFDRRVDVEISELVAREPQPDDDYRLDPELRLDPEPLVRDAVGLELPFAPLCQEDCRGLCTTCGADLNEGPCSCRGPIDPRWAALEGFGEG